MALPLAALALPLAALALPLVQCLRAARRHLSKIAGVQTFQPLKFETVEGVCNCAVTKDSEHVSKALEALRIHSKPPH